METTECILENFKRISAIPRQTSHEEKISAWLQEWAAQRGFRFKTDSARNLAISIPASPGYQARSALVLQGHMDMVCEKTPDSPHDFSRDPIRCIQEENWLRADRTTLGADNGIALALALTLVEDQNVSHPPLELLFTVEEEIGIGGAGRLDPDLISGKTLVNLDSEDEGVFVVGCAGGETTHIQLPVTYEPAPKGQKRLRLMVSGLQGGHSGVDINKQRGNAIKILTRALDHLQKNIPIRIGLLGGGTAHNVIPRQAEAVFTCSTENENVCSQQISIFEREIQSEFSETDPGLRFELTPDYDNDNNVVSITQTAGIISLLLALPDGVANMSPDIDGLVETSNNLAIIQLIDSLLHITSSQRSTVMAHLNEITWKIDSIAHLAGAQVEHMNNYPAWQPNRDSALLSKALRIYENLFHQKPEVNIIHAGLECGTIAERCGVEDMISLGPTIKNAHSPDEMLYIPSIIKVWQFLVELLKSPDE